MLTVLAVLAVLAVLVALVVLVYPPTGLTMSPWEGIGTSRPSALMTSSVVQRAALIFWLTFESEYDHLLFGVPCRS